MSQSSRRGNHTYKSSIDVMTALTLFGLWISNTILGCHGLPRPEAKNDGFRLNLATMYDAPLITPLMEDIILEVNTNYTLRCESNEEIVWRVPKLFSDSSESLSTSESNHSFSSDLHLKDVQNEAVGSYYCIKKSSLNKDIDDMEEEEFYELVNKYLASSIYIYVNDSDNMLVPFETQYPVAYQDFTIPCKPTLPTVEVLLTAPNGVTYSSEITGRYNPRRGFVIQIGAVTDSGEYKCRPKVPSQNNEKEETSIHIGFRVPRPIAPLITPFLEDITLEVNSNYTLSCESDEEIIWKNPNFNTKYSWVNVTIYNPFSKLLQLGNVHKESVGSYYCIKNSSLHKEIVDMKEEDLKELVDNNLASSVYIFVNDLDNLLVPFESSFAYAYQYQDFIIPCKPTSPDVEVFLSVQNGDDSSDSQIISSSRILTQTKNFPPNNIYSSIVYDPKVGFIIKHVENIAEKFRCVAQYGQKNHSEEYNVKFLPRPTHVNKPTITSDSKGHAYVGDSFQLTCVVKTVRYKIEWVTPPDVDETRIEISDTSNYGISNLTIRNSKKSDSGSYKCIINDHLKSKNMAQSIYLMTILNKNESYISMKEPYNYYIIKEKVYKTVTLNVDYRADPPATLKWYKPDGTQIHPTHKYVINTTDSSSALKIKSPQMIDSGDYVVRAENGFESEIRTFNVFISDAPIVTINDAYVQVGEEAHLECRVLSYPTANVTWVFKPCKIHPRWPSCDNQTEQHFADNASIPIGKTGIELIHRLDFRPTTPGVVDCIAENVIKRTIDKGHVLIGDITNNMTIFGIGEGRVITRGDEVSFTCAALAYHYAEDLVWLKDGNILLANDNLEITTSQSDYSYKKTLRFKSITDDDAGSYECRAKEVVYPDEFKSEFIYISVHDFPSLKLGWIVGAVFFFIVLILVVIYTCVRATRERKLLRELKAAGLANFEKGAVDHINPELTLDEQADLLPYDRRFEFPRNKLKLGKQLGAGAFGVVLKAHAEGIKADEKETVVAVKMVKRTADNEVMKALVSELKIMVHLGQHLNVVNLLGAVTENIAKREVMVIVEYCRYGNVQNFLLRNRKRFIDQINPETDKIDPKIVTQCLSDEPEFNCFSQETSHTPLVQTMMSTASEGEDNILSNNSAQPAWRSNYKTDSTEPTTITTSDLVSWAFQVARGMDYLSSRKVLHGDLAARNILLCEDNVVKICDFGLARSMYKGEIYKKQGDARLPIKWLALESLTDQVFSIYTDIWAFGIVLWEFFSLGKAPYPGLDPNQDLCMKLKDGYRMEKPQFANLDLYYIMLECWSFCPERRPLFHVLVQKFAKMLEDDITNHYLDLNTAYMKANDEYFKRNGTDYLALMGSPDELAPPPLNYVNLNIRTDNLSGDYVRMSKHSGTAIFSPTRPKDFETTNDSSNTTKSFTLPDKATQQHSPTLANNLDIPTNKSRQKENIKLEEIPMLHKIHDSDGDSNPEQPQKYNKTEATTQSQVMPTPTPRHQSAISNPNYQILKTADEGTK